MAFTFKIFANKHQIHLNYTHIQQGGLGVRRVRDLYVKVRLDHDGECDGSAKPSRFLMESCPFPLVRTVVPASPASASEPWIPDPVLRSKP